MRVIGTSARIISLSAAENSVSLTVKGTDNIHMFTRLRVPFAIKSAEGKQKSGKNVKIVTEYEPQSRTVLLSYDGTAEETDITLY